MKIRSRLVTELAVSKLEKPVAAAKQTVQQHMIDFGHKPGTWSWDLAGWWTLTCTVCGFDGTVQTDRTLKDFPGGVAAAVRDVECPGRKA